MVHLLGELDLGAEERFLAGMDALDPQSPTIILDLRELEFIDSTGIRMIVGQQQELAKIGRSLGVYVVPGRVQRVFELVGLNGMLIRRPPTPAGDHA